MAKWQYTRAESWRYPSLGFAATFGDVLEADFAPDANWDEVDGGTAATLPPVDTSNFTEPAAGTIPVYNAVTNRAEYKTLAELELLTQTEQDARFDTNLAGENSLIGLGPDLKVVPDDGNAGQRMSLTGTSSTIMPYFQVVANTRTGTDGGHAVAGLQVHLGPDTGGGTNREFLAIEAIGENASQGPHFRIQPWASGTGVKRALRFLNGSAEVMTIDPAYNRPLFPNGAGAVGDGASATLGYGVVHKSGPGETAQIVFAKTGGTAAAVTAPSNAYTLGQVQFGSQNQSGSFKASAVIRAVADGNWTFDSSHGSEIEMLVCNAGTTAQTLAFQVDYPNSASDTSIAVAVNKSGTVSFARVKIGATDSGGSGFRALVVDN